MPIRTSVKDQSVLQKRAAAGAILRSMGLGGGIHPTSKSIFWAQDAQLAGFCQYSFRYGYIVEKSLFFSFRFAIYDMYLSLFIWKYLSFFLKPEINLQVFLLWSPWKGEIFFEISSNVWNYPSHIFVMIQVKRQDRVKSTCFTPFTNLENWTPVLQVRSLIKAGM